MFELGDKVITVTDDALDGLPGVVMGLSERQPAAYVTLDEDAHKEGDFSMFFLNTELRKVEA